MADIPVNASSRFVVVDVVVNGQVNFDFDFRADDVADLKATYTTAAGVDTQLSGGTDFTASGLGTADGGTITLTSFTATIAGSKVTIYSDIVIDRENDYQRDVFADDLNREQDTIFMVLQELARDISRSIKARLDGGMIAINRVFVSDGAGGYTAGPSLEDIANSQQYAQAAQDSADDAQLSEDAALLYANNSAGSATLAQQFATYPEDAPIPGTGGLFSAFHWYRKTLAIYASVVAGFAAAIHAAPAKTAVDDADELALADSAAAWALKKFTLANLITSIFKLTRTIPNAVFASATFAWKNAGGFAASINTTAHTAARNILWPDRDINLGNVPLAPKFKGAPTAVTLGGLVTQPHGFGVVPYTYSAWARCKVAVEGFSVGDEVPAIGIVNSGGSTLGGQVYADATNVYIRVSNAFVVYVHNKTTGAVSSAASLSATNWDMFTKAESY